MLVFMHYISTLCSVSLRSGLKNFIKLYIFFFIFCTNILKLMLSLNQYICQKFFLKRRTMVLISYCYFAFLSVRYYGEKQCYCMSEDFILHYGHCHSQKSCRLLENHEKPTKAQDQQNLQCHMTLRTLQCHVTIGANNGHVINKTCNIM